MDEKQTGLVHNPVCGQKLKNELNWKKKKDTNGTLKSFLRFDNRKFILIANIFVS